MHRQLHLRVTPLEQRQPKAQPRRGELVDLAAGEHEGEARAAHLGEHLLPAAQPLRSALVEYGGEHAERGRRTCEVDRLALGWRARTRADELLDHVLGPLLPHRLSARPAGPPSLLVGAAVDA